MQTQHKEFYSANLKGNLGNVSVDGQWTKMHLKV
jgi:hypothetical protein